MSVVMMIVLLLGASSCSVQEVKFVGLNNVEVSKIEGNEVYLDVAVKLDNPNTFDIGVVSSDLDLYLSNQYIGKAKLGEKFDIKKGGINDYDLSIIAKGENLSKQLMPILLGAALTGSVEARIKGDIKGKAFLISKTLPIDVTDTVKLSK